MARVEIDAHDSDDRWRWVCPNGHCSWEPTNHHFWCRQCASSHADVDPEFSELVDATTRESYARDEVKIKDYRRKTA
ncbi:hypothetical protein [Halobacterium sp. CBA1126]|uniref:hypothetical protein n=1 Tax=Halobacterium sp. CBA1126 TaxID=2668074 RepID=UPI0012F916F5|nr:hypothetical protein [Halobacterium sp. CBA1126]MUV59796.1 hypothetical protein [Halobacterium sp. CBA1126]